MFFKVVQDRTIVGVCTENDFRRWQAKHDLVVVSDIDRVEAVDYGGILYHDEWMADSGHLQYSPAAVTEITEDEYYTIKVQLDAGKIPDDGSLDDEVTVEEPAPDPDQGEGETVRKTAAQLLQEQIDESNSQAYLAARFASL